jgi:hypothetical protein
MQNAQLARWWLYLVGATLVVVGLLGFVSNPLVGPSGLVATDNLHNAIHILTGLLAFGLVFGLRNDPGLASILFGALYAVVFVVTIFSPSLFGLFSVPVNAIDHVIHVGVAVVSLALGWMARIRAAMAAH